MRPVTRKRNEVDKKRKSRRRDGVNRALVFFSATRKFAFYQLGPHRDSFGPALTTRIMVLGEELIQTEQSKEKGMNWKEKAMIRATVGCFFGIILMHLVSGIFEWIILQKQHKAQKAIYEMLQEQRRILEETQKVFAEISKAQAAATIPSNPTDAVQETAAVNPDAVDSVPCCGEPTDLPPVVDPVSSKSEDANAPPNF